MTGGNRVVGLWSDRAAPREPDVGDDAVAAHIETDSGHDPIVYAEDEPEQPRETGRLIVSIFCLVAAGSK